MSESSNPFGFTPEQREAHRKAREEFKDRPNLRQLVESGRINPGGPAGAEGVRQTRVILAALKAAREARGLGVEAVAEKLGHAGYAPRVAELETGTGDAVGGVVFLNAYAAALGFRLWLTIEPEEDTPR